MCNLCDKDSIVIRANYDDPNEYSKITSIEIVQSPEKTSIDLGFLDELQDEDLNEFSFVRRDGNNLIFVGSTKTVIYRIISKPDMYNCVSAERIYP